MHSLIDICNTCLIQFICDLFNDAISSSAYTVPHGTMIDE